ncbi:40S ribosomal eS8 domain-containing protein [Aspergillus candidus]|uniref:40S ribosomal protein S8 n=1 Tax=Aspergillus candidus TaxID=41067 RepID=A0A2I2FMN3_ASPCN|nr:40S ribosomal protein S8e [Aspergillus candidus]PLB41902.1 40S ribosomal protein S8e [Aspergillus candidus]
MGISRDSRHKRSATGAKRSQYRKKRAFEKGRQTANTRIGSKRIHLVRTRGGNRKFRALRLESGNFSWGSEGISRKTRVIVVAYHPSNNELVRTNTLTKSAVVQIDAAPFRQWYEAHYGQPIGRRRQQKSEVPEEKKSNSVQKKQAARFAESGKVESAIERQFESGRVYAVIASRPGQSGRVDGYILEGDELAFYQKAIRKTKMPSTKTRLCLLSDTHTTLPASPAHTTNPYRHPLPQADVLIHAGDLTKVGRLEEHTRMVDLLASAPAELKLVIPGNHDITLDEEYYHRIGHYRHRYRSGHKGSLPQEGPIEDPAVVKALYTDESARAAGIVYLEEGTHRLRVPSTGATFTVYASPWTPEFCEWAFAYKRGAVDRFNPPSPRRKLSEAQPGAKRAFSAPHPAPDFPDVDIVITHGPPYGVLDRVVPGGFSVGCEDLFKAVERARPLLHVFGHIHEGYGAVRYEWSSRNESMVQCDGEKTVKERGAYIDGSAGSGTPLRVGDETLFINASVCTVDYEAVNAPWVVDLDLPIQVGG